MSVGRSIGAPESMILLHGQLGHLHTASLRRCSREPSKKHMPPPMTSRSTTPSRASITPNLSLTLAPPRTAKKASVAQISLLPAPRLLFLKVDLPLKAPSLGGRQLMRGNGGTPESVIDIPFEGLPPAPSTRYWTNSGELSVSPGQI